MPESVLSRLARSTELSKTESHSAGAARIQSRRILLCGRTHKNESDCPRNLINIRCRVDPVNASASQNFHQFSTMGKEEDLQLRRRTGEQKTSPGLKNSRGWHGFSRANKAETESRALAPEGD